jgi:hypothetical protein
VANLSTVEATDSVLYFNSWVCTLFGNVAFFAAVEADHAGFVVTNAGIVIIIIWQRSMKQATLAAMDFYTISLCR